MKTKVAILGASGYGGTELAMVLAKHPAVEVTALGGDSQAGKRLEEIEAAAEGLNLPALESLDAVTAAERAGLVFLGLPHTQSMKFVPELLEKGCKVIDLSGDFRLRDAGAYEAFYKTAHSAKALLEKAVYGLPEVNRKAIAQADLVANPGCYPTVSALALLPLVEQAGLIDDASIIIDAKSGYSGAGRKAASDEAKAARRDNFSAYKVGGVHQHIPEIEQTLSAAAGRNLKVSFTPHLLELERGILATAYVTLKKDLDLAALRALYQARYAKEPFVLLEDEGHFPDLRNVQGTNDCRIGLALDNRTGRAVVVAAEDNLGKGAALQAVQNMNLMLGLDETTGLKPAKVLQ